MACSHRSEKEKKKKNQDGQEKDQSAVQKSGYSFLICYAHRAHLKNINTYFL